MTGLVGRMATFDSRQELDAAWADRYWDALTCGMEGREFGACYLFGYVIEMLLKLAYFRFLEVPMTDDLAPYLREARRSAQFSRRRANLHSIEAWAEMLLAAREREGRPLNAILAAEILVRTGEVADNWVETMRYRRSIDAGSEMDKLHKQAEWFRDHHDALWS